MAKMNNAKLIPELLPVDKLISDPANARKHNERNLETIKASLQAFGQQKPIVVGKDNTVVAGNGMLQAAKELGWTEIEAVRTKLTGAERKAYAIADNRTAELAEWDWSKLADSLQELDNGQFNVDLTGFSGADIESLMHGLDNAAIKEQEYDENLATETKCPKCGYEW